jgi:hypothetical protein
MTDVVEGSRLDASACAVLAALSAGAGGIHLALVPSHWDESVAEGIGFAVAGWAQLAFAVLLFARPGRWLLRAGIVVNASAIGAWIVSRTAGLPFGPHAGHAESAGFVDVTTVAFEAVLLVACAALVLRPGAGSQARGALLAAAVGAGVLGLTTGALASPGARDHAAGSHGTHGAAGDGAPAGGPHDHGDGGTDDLPAGDDKGFSLLSNGQHDHSAVLHELDAATARELDRQLDVTREVARLTPTVAAAEKAGYKRVGPYLPGIGAHYWKGAFGDYGRGPEWNPDGIVDDTDLRNPLMLIFDGTEPASEIAGFMFYSTKPSEPEGFAGRNDSWHYHEQLCLKIMPGGNVDVPYGLDNAATPEQCDRAGGRILPVSNYMVHVWSVPGFEMPAEYGGTFGEAHPKLTCGDGTYYQLPLDDWAAHPRNVCKVP